MHDPPGEGLIWETATYKLCYKNVKELDILWQKLKVQ